MATAQQDFLNIFKEVFAAKFKTTPDWFGGQRHGNFACLEPVRKLRRNGSCKPGERFELGDLRTVFNERIIIIEFDGGGVSIQNLLKYWPYVRGELSVSPLYPVVLCHFSNWGSWGSHRDLWEWLMRRIQEDSNRKTNIIGHQFDHGFKDCTLRDRSIREAIDWISEQCQ